MEPVTRLRIAKSFILLGAIPFFLGVLLVKAMSVSAGQFGGGLSDLLPMASVLVASYLASVVLAGGAALGVRQLQRKHDTLRSNTSKLFWKLTLLVMALPILLAVPLLIYLNLTNA